jgi:hypothetical protein
MRSVRRSLLASVVLAGALALAASGSTASASVLDVPATADLFAAGLKAPPDLPGGGGTLPPVLRFAPRANQVLTFQQVNGDVTWGSDPFGPAGDPTMKTNIFALGGISGLVAPGWIFLAGVFLGPGPPAKPPPPRLRMDNAPRLITVRPKLQQVFYVGDGRSERGDVRAYVVPAKATRLYLGFLDAAGPAKPPGYYQDNDGSLKVSFSIARGAR